MSDKARILIFTGDGKGKTTAALGLALRASGHGLHVRILQFIKADASVGEVSAIAGNPLITLTQTGMGFLPKQSSPRWADHQAAARAGLALAREALAGGTCDVLILDEICTAVAKDLLSEKDVIDVVALAGPGCVVVLTGRGATEGLIALADTVTEMRCVKHGMQAGWAAQKGVEL
jgi:cob(I)alamin adenosyltransferase